jgi:hypothetical protein
MNEHILSEIIEEFHMLQNIPLQWWPTFFEPRHTLRVSHDQNHLQRTIHGILKEFLQHTSVPQHIG